MGLAVGAIVGEGVGAIVGDDGAEFEGDGEASIVAVGVGLGPAGDAAAEPLGAPVGAIELHAARLSARAATTSRRWFVMFTERIYALAPI